MSPYSHSHVSGFEVSPWDGYLLVCVDSMGCIFYKPRNLAAVWLESSVHRGKIFAHRELKRNRA